MMEYNSTLFLLSNRTVGSTTYIYLQTKIRYWAQTNRLYEVDEFRKYINPMTISLNLETTEMFICTFATISYTPSSIGFYRTTEGFNLLYIGLQNGKVAIVNQATKVYITMTGTICTVGYVYDMVIDQNSNYWLMSCAIEDAIQLWTTNGNIHTSMGVKITIESPYGMSYDSWGSFSSKLRAVALPKVTIFNPIDYPFP